jgi:hypothetical protein
MTCAELLEVIYSFYPRGMFVGGLGYEQTVERQRQRDAARRGVAEFPKWKAMIRRLGERYRLMDHSLSLLAGGLDPAYSADIDIPEGGTLYFHVSLLGPYYGIHRTGAPGDEPAARDIAREIEATYPGYQPIPPELGDEVVPDVCVDGALLGEATIHHCLFSGVWEWASPMPPPHPPPAAPAPVRGGRRMEFTIISERREGGDDPDGEPHDPEPHDDDDDDAQPTKAPTRST